MKIEIKKVYALIVFELNGEERVMGIPMPDSVMKVLKKEVDSL